MGLLVLLLRAKEDEEDDADDHRSVDCIVRLTSVFCALQVYCLVFWFKSLPVVSLLIGSSPTAE